MKVAIFLVVLFVFGAMVRPVKDQIAPTKTDIRVSEQPQVQTHCGKTPVKRFGFCWVLGEAPTLLDDAPLQAGNTAPRVKVHPKNSRDIKRNYLGITTTRMPRSTANDYLPVEAIHLIDANLQTCWMSRGQTRPSVQPVWIRLDFPMERTVTRIVLRKRPPSAHPRNPWGWRPFAGAEEVGRGMPATIVIKASRDGETWRTLFDGSTDNGSSSYLASARADSTSAIRAAMSRGFLK